MIDNSDTTADLRNYFGRITALELQMAAIRNVINIQDWAEWCEHDHRVHAGPCESCEHFHPHERCKTCACCCYTNATYGYVDAY